MQYLLICYMIHRSSYLKFGGPDPARPRAPKSGGSADPADPVVPTPLDAHVAVYESMTTIGEHQHPEFDIDLRILIQYT